MVKCNNGDECRSFKISGAGIPFTGGRYVGKTFSIASKRAASMLYRKVNNDPSFAKYKSKPSIKFILKETTKGSAKKTKAYIVNRVELDKPIVISRNGVEVSYKFKYVVNELKVDEDTLASELV